MSHQEDEFLQVARRLLRSGQAHDVLLVRLSGFAHVRNDPGLLGALQNTVRDAVHGLGAGCYALKSGDFFLAGTGMTGARRARVIDAVTAATIADQAILGEPPDELIRIYSIPRDWVAMRDHIASPGAEPGDPGAPAGPAGSGPIPITAFLPPEPEPPALEGPLSSRMLARVEEMIGHLEFSRYVRRQPVYQTDFAARWTPVWSECSTDISRVRQDRFPGVDLRASGALFLELCKSFDQRMLRQVQAEAPWTRGAIGLNLTLATLQAPAFRAFAEVCRPERRSNVVLELHRADLFATLSSRGLVLESLREAGWRLALDGVTPSVLPYLNLAHPVFDFVKVVLIRDELKALSQRECLAALRAVDRDKLVFARCDDPGAIDLARALGVTRVQGTLIDRLAAEAALKSAASA